MTGRVSCKSGYGELVRGPPANDGRDQLGSTGKLGAKTMIALPADQNHTHVKCVGNWRQEARICDQAILLLSCEQWFLQDGRSVRPGETTARRVSFFPFVLKKEKKTPDRRLRGTQRTYQKTVSTESHSEQQGKRSEKNLSGNSFVWEFIAKTTRAICG